MEKTIEELILQELRELKGAVNSIGERMDALEKKVDSLEMRMISTEEMISDMVESIVEIRTACNSLLDWADRVHSVEYKKDKNYPQVGPVGTVDFRGNAVGEEHARYYVESGGKRTYY